MDMLKAVKGIHTCNRDENYYNSAAWRGTRKYEGGGVLINQTVHNLDLIAKIHLCSLNSNLKIKALFT